MTANEIFEIMERYSLTLRSLPSEEASMYIYSKSNLEYVRQQGEDYEIVDKTTAVKLTPEQFKHLFNDSDCAYVDADGYLVRRYIKHIRRREGGWLVKIDKSHNSTQTWNRDKTDFYSKNPEEAIQKAVEYIESRK